LAQVKNPGENAEADPTNGVIDWSVNWADNGKQWLTAVVDNDAQSTPQSGSLWLNWIRSGSNGRGLPAAQFDGFLHDFIGTGSLQLDPSQAYEKIWNGRIAPYGLTAREKYSAANGRNTYGFAWSGNTAWLQNPIQELNSFELVITPDKSKWTRCAVLEMADDEVTSGTEGRMAKFNMRLAPSKDKDFKDIAGSFGLSYFPGYVINLETGERMNIAFGEDSYVPGENGRDMIWNPTSNIYNDNGNYPVIGGKHFIYIFGSGNHGIGRNVTGSRYLGEEEVNFDRFKLGFQSTTAGSSPTSLQKRLITSQINWVIPTYLAPGYEMKNGIPPTEVRMKVRVAKAYTSFNTGDNRNSPDWNRDGVPDNEYALPMYEFDGAEIAPKISADIGRKNLDLVNVVPNPYRGFSEYENSPIDARVKITNLPPTCTIKIFDMAGNLIRTVDKSDEFTYYEWDLKNNSRVPIASGLYLIHIKAPGIGEKIVRWYGIMPAVDLDTY
jgi:hypothetical protein